VLTAVVAAADAALSIVPFVAVFFSTEDEVRLLNYYLVYMFP